MTRTSAGKDAGTGLLAKWIRLNVGGVMFETTMETLCKEPDSFLAKLCRLGFTAASMDSNGAYRIDRDPQYFRLVLNYLRTGSLTIDSGLLIEAQFYGLPKLAEMVGHHLRNHRPCDS